MSASDKPASVAHLDRLVRPLRGALVVALVAWGVLGSALLVRLCELVSLVIARQDRQAESQLSQSRTTMKLAGVVDAILDRTGPGVMFVCSACAGCGRREPQAGVDFNGAKFEGSVFCEADLRCRACRGHGWVAR